MQISIIIPTCNRPGDLELCLATLGQQLTDLRDVNFEVIITDDGRRQPVTPDAIVAFPWVKLVRGPMRGPAANRNYGASVASGEILLFLDDDCVPVAGLLRSYFKHWQNANRHGLSLAYGPTIAVGGERSLLFDAPHNPNGDCFISANFSISKDFFVKIGRFDERYPSAAMEDVEFYERFVRLGGSKHFLPEAMVHHPYRPVGRAKSLAKKWEGRVIYALDQNASPRSLFYRIPWHVANVIKSRFRGKPFTIENCYAAVLFFFEWLWVLAYTPFWVVKWSRRERSHFWMELCRDHLPIPNNGL
jgi:GT2 family glycosyltransferase